MKNPIRGDIENTRMFTLEQAKAYTGMGRTTCRQWCDKIGATRKFGVMVRFDRTVIDRALDKMSCE